MELAVGADLQLNALVKGIVASTDQQTEPPPVNSKLGRRENAGGRIAQIAFGCRDQIQAVLAKRVMPAPLVLAAANASAEEVPGLDGLLAEHGTSRPWSFAGFEVEGLAGGRENR